MALKGVIFDSDGVLVNTEELCAHAEADVLNSYGMKCTFEMRMPHITGISLKQHEIILAEDFRKAMGRAMPETVMPDIMNAYQVLEDKSELAVDGVRDVIDMLRHHRVPMAIGSNSRQESLKRKLNRAGLYELFNARNIHGNSPERQPKPAPDVYITAARSMNLRPQECVVVEDSPIGVKSGKLAGSYVVGFAGICHIIKDQHKGLFNAGADEVVAHMNILEKRLIQLLSAPS